MLPLVLDPPRAVSSFTDLWQNANGLALPAGPWAGAAPAHTQLNAPFAHLTRCSGHTRLLALHGPGTWAGSCCLFASGLFLPAMTTRLCCGCVAPPPHCTSQLGLSRLLRNGPGWSWLPARILVPAGPGLVLTLPGAGGSGGGAETKQAGAGGEPWHCWLAPRGAGARRGWQGQAETGR